MTITVESVVFGSHAMPVIAGPCVIESRDHSLEMATELNEIFSKLAVPFIFKSSFDKANRIAGDSFRGPGIDEGLQILSAVKNETDVLILTDIHTPDQAKPASEVVDVLQIPAFLCRQTDFIAVAAGTRAIVNLKKGQFLSPQEMGQVVKKAEETGLF